MDEITVIQGKAFDIEKHVWTLRAELGEMMEMLHRDDVIYPNLEEWKGRLDDDLHLAWQIIGYVFARDYIRAREILNAD